ncbi:MAG: lamin tail domain-containing protein, partial [Saprospiraceae bacterium]|nr:lamin tail domain-containing protein [Saprospiraceae bacterium]
MLTKKCLMVSAMLWLATLSQLAQAQEIVLITEFMAANRTGLKDQDGQASDWIEIFNGGTNSLNLEGWHLTDDANDLTKWSFPATNLNPNSYLIVFASGSDRRIIGQPLHTSFQLSAGGEYLALVKPDGTNVASAFAPVFPPQFNDISFGMSTVTDPALLITTNAPVRVYVPTNDALVTSWV